MKFRIQFDPFHPLKGWTAQTYTDYTTRTAIIKEEHDNLNYELSFQQLAELTIEPKPLLLQAPYHQINEQVPSVTHIYPCLILNEKAPRMGLAYRPLSGQQLRILSHGLQVILTPDSIDDPDQILQNAPILIKPGKLSAPFYLHGLPDHTDLFFSHYNRRESK